jgi:hypothetical protein
MAHAHARTKIQTSRKTSNIMNSKSEYNRSSIPRLGVKMGPKVFKTKFKTKSEFELETKKYEEERETEEKIRQMRKDRGKMNQRRHYADESSAPKRRKTGADSYKSSRNATGDKDKNPTENRKEDEEPLMRKEDGEKSPEKKKRKTQTIMDRYLNQGVSVDKRIQVEKQKSQAEYQFSLHEGKDQAEKQAKAEHQCIADEVSDLAEKETDQAEQQSSAQGGKV